MTKREAQRKGNALKKRLNGRYWEVKLKWVQKYNSWTPKKDWYYYVTNGFVSVQPMGGEFACSFDIPKGAGFSSHSRIFRQDPNLAVRAFLYEASQSAQARQKFIERASKAIF